MPGGRSAYNGRSHAIAQKQQRITRVPVLALRALIGLLGAATLAFLLRDIDAMRGGLCATETAIRRDLAERNRTRRAERSRRPMNRTISTHSQSRWRATLNQIAGKFTLDEPFEAYWSNVTLLVTPRGIATRTLRSDKVLFGIEYALLDSEVVVTASTKWDERGSGRRWIYPGGTHNRARPPFTPTFHRLQPGSRALISALRRRHTTRQRA